MINNHFATLGKVASASAKNNTFMQFLGFPNLQTFLIEPTNADEIYRITENLSNTKASPFDDINMKMLKKIISVLCLPLALIINKSFETL